MRKVLHKFCDLFWATVLIMMAWAAVLGWMAGQEEKKLKDRLFNRPQTAKGE